MTMLKQPIKARLDGRKVLILSHKRYVEGGYVVWVSWETDEDAPPKARFEDGTIHPAHRAGYRWETNLGLLKAA